MKNRGNKNKVAENKFSHLVFIV
jgi:hypothetical protein